MNCGFVGLWIGLLIFVTSIAIGWKLMMALQWRRVLVPFWEGVSRQLICIAPRGRVEAFIHANEAPTLPPPSPVLVCCNEMSPQVALVSSDGAQIKLNRSVNDSNLNLFILLLLLLDRICDHRWMKLDRVSPGAARCRWRRPAVSLDDAVDWRF